MTTSTVVRSTFTDTTLELLEGNKPALDLYLSEGFKVVERIEGQLEGNEDFAATGLILRRENN